MAKPRVFISSTFYDLRQIRLDLDKFIEGMGYEPVRNEEGDIPYGKENELQDYCYKEISNVDILVSIIGGRYGSESNTRSYSVSQKELKTAIDEGKQVFIFILKDVASEYLTYKDNKDVKGVRYHYVDDERIYSFIEEIYSLPKNNNIKEFETADDILNYLREQWAGLFKKFFEDYQRSKEAFVLRDMENTAQTLHTLVEYLQSQNQGNSDAFEVILKTNHPLVMRLKTLLDIPYNFYIEGLEDMNHLLFARRYKRVDESFVWENITKEEKRVLRIDESLFDTNKRLRSMKASEWSEEMCAYEAVSIIDDKDDNLPF